MDLPHGYRRAIELGPEMELRAGRTDGAIDRQRVREHLTIGRSAASDLVIDHAGVNLIHARVVPGIGGSWELRCVGGARLLLDDQTSVDRMELSPGVTIGVGETRVECAGIGDPKTQPPKPESEKVEPAAEAPAQSSAPIEMPRLVVCPTCFKDMTSIPVAARFCPQCGGQLPPRDIAGFLIPPEESSPLYPVYQSLREELEKKLADESPQIASSMIILAYANAMLNLGWKYEHGRGLLRNVEEASRCYAKAGRLSEA